MHQSQPVPKSVVLGLILALSSILSGFILGGIFGAAEDSIQNYLKESANAVSETVYASNEAAKEAVVKKSWSYLKRAHLHAGAIGSAASGAILGLILLSGLGLLARLSSLALGLGALLYSAFWLFAGLRAPALGSTSLAKDAFEFLALPGAGLSIMGMCGTILCLFGRLFRT